MNNTTKKLSHIILYVNKNVPEEDISAFCTNVRSEDTRMGFTYLCYDNHFFQNISERLVNMTDDTSDHTDSLFIITDSPEAIEYALNRGIACAALCTGSGKGADFGKVLYCIEDIAYMTLGRIVRMWQRHHGIAWIIKETKRLVIREQVISDIDRLYEIYDDREALKYVEDLYEDRREEEEYLRKYIDNQYRFYEFGLWALVLKETGQLIGRVGIGIREGYATPELGYMIGKNYRGRGYAKEALVAIMEYGSEELGFSKYMAFTDRRNTPSVKLLESLGFSPAGRDVIMGREHDMYLLTCR